LCVQKLQNGKIQIKIKLKVTQENLKPKSNLSQLNQQNEINC